MALHAKQGVAIQDGEGGIRERPAYGCSVVLNQHNFLGGREMRIG
jgi:hypothetical protein